MLPAGGADVIAGCPFTVATAISFHFVTSLAACATAGAASATTVAKTANRPSRTGFLRRAPLASACESSCRTSVSPWMPGRDGQGTGSSEPGGEHTPASVLFQVGHEAEIREVVRRFRIADQARVH